MRFIVRLGTHDISTKKGVKRKIKEIRDHPQFTRRGNHNDIAIVLLSNPVTFDFGVFPICLPHSGFKRTDIPSNESLVLGWGTTREMDKSDILQVAELTIWEMEQCQKAYKKITNVTENFICAGHIEGSGF